MGVETSLRSIVATELAPERAIQLVVALKLALGIPFSNKKINQKRP